MTCSHCTDSGVGLGTERNQERERGVCNPMNPNPVPYPCPGVVSTVHSIIQKPIIPVPVSAPPRPIPGPV